MRGQVPQAGGGTGRQGQQGGPNVPKDASPLAFYVGQGGKFATGAGVSGFHLFRVGPGQPDLFGVQYGVAGQSR